MGPDDALGPRGRARRVLNADGQHGVRRAQRHVRRIAVKRGEAFGLGGQVLVLRCGAIVRFGDGEPFDARAGGRNERGESRLRDRADDIGMVAEIDEIVGDGTRIGGDGDGADMRAGIPGDEAFRAVVEMDENALALLHAPLLQACRDLARLMLEPRIGPDAGFALEGLPDEEGMVRPRRDMDAEKMRHVEIRERVDKRRTERGHR